MSDRETVLTYTPTSFSAGRMDFTWEELNEEELAQAYADWEAGKGLIGGDPRRRPGSELLPVWAIGKPFFRTLALDHTRGGNGEGWRQALARAQGIEVEIGFGRGDFLLGRADRHPDRLFVGYEVKTKAARLMLERIGRTGLENVWVSDDDCRFSMPRVLADGSVDVAHVLFPDPWWKEQHRVKRLFSPPFVELMAQKLKHGGLLHFKSDVKEYGELTAYLVAQNDAFSEHRPELAAVFGENAPTHREFWCKEHGRPVYGYYFSRR